MYALVEVDLGALARNYGKLARACAAGDCGAVVKANAYGLGVGPVSRRLWAAGCRQFFVATLGEGVELRSLLPDAEILVFEGLADHEAASFLDARLLPVLNTRGQLERWGRSGPAAIHIDTGMCRLGLSADDIGALTMAADRRPELDVRYVLTHLACADEPDHALNREQIGLFEQLRRLWPAARTSIGNSAGILLGPPFQGDLARPGIALYGGNPMRRGENAVEPVVRVGARVLQLRDVPAGHSIGYGASFVAPAAMRVAVVGIGYADGYLRSLSNCGIGDVAGRRVPVVGRVSMDLVCLDVSSLSRDEVAEGDWATMIGGEAPLEEVAAQAGTINYEVLTALGPRLERVYTEDEPA